MPRIAPPGRLARTRRWASGAIAALGEGLARLRQSPDTAGGDDRDLWLLILASDPDGIWYAWPSAYRRPQLDDATD